MSINSKFGAILKQQQMVQKKVIAQEQSSKDEVKVVRPPIYDYMPRPEQVCRSTSANLPICAPDGFFGVDHPNTLWMVNLLKDTSEWRLQKCLVSTRTRPLFDVKKYYQILDRPSYYLGQAAGLEKSLFKPHAMLMLNAYGVAIYLKSQVGAEMMAHANTNDSQVVNCTEHQYAAFVHDREHDILRFDYDFLCIKRGYYEGLQFLAIAGWDPSHTSCFMYRRKYYQYSIPFTDWMDVVRYLLKRNPCMDVADLVKRMYKLQYLVLSGVNFSMTALKQCGKIMIEPFELKEVKENTEKEKKGDYVGRKMLKNKSTPIQDEYSHLFADSKGSTKSVRPVVPNVMSYVRRLLTYQYYFDNENLFALPQIIRAVSCFRKHDFFVAPQTIKITKESNSIGNHDVYLDPLVFQINFFLELRSNGVLLRHKHWVNLFEENKGCQINETERAWTYRFDIINCLSLLTGLLQNCLIRNTSSTVIESLCDLIIHILVDSEIVETFLRYSYYDTFFGLTSVINCVPNLASKTVLRLLKKAPITLVSNYEVAHLLRTFTYKFWRRSKEDDTIVTPSTPDEMTEFLVCKKRRTSMKVEGTLTGEAVSGVSSAGAAGGLTTFIRSYDSMIDVTPDQEGVEETSTETTKKQDEERMHVRQYRRLEIDARYSGVFPDYNEELNRPVIDYDETMLASECERAALERRSLSMLGKLSN